MIEINCGWSIEPRIVIWDDDDDDHPTNCCNCGAPLNKSPRCEYCGTINRKDNNNGRT